MSVFLCVLKILLRLFPDVKSHSLLNILVLQDFEQDAQESGGVTSSGGILDKWSCGTEGYG